jgi:hypothetical protein
LRHHRSRPQKANTVIANMHGPLIPEGGPSPLPSPPNRTSPTQCFKPGPLACGAAQPTCVQLETNSVDTAAAGRASLYSLPHNTAGHEQLSPAIIAVLLPAAETTRRAAAARRSRSKNLRLQQSIRRRAARRSVRPISAHHAFASHHLLPRRPATLWCARLCDGRFTRCVYSAGGEVGWSADGEGQMTPWHEIGRSFRTTTASWRRQAPTIY